LVKSRQVDDDQVEAIARVLEVGAGVLVEQPGARVVERPLVHLRQIPLALLDHLAVDVHHQTIGDAPVPQDLADRGALAAADHHGAPRVGVDEEPRLDEDLVVDELVGLARLYAPVQDETLPVRERLEDLHELERRLAGHDGPGDGVGVALDRRGGFEEPLVVGRGGHPRTARGLW
jgi:hypothetical protein